MKADAPVLRSRKNRRGRRTNTLRRQSGILSGGERPDFAHSETLPLYFATSSALVPVGSTPIPFIQSTPHCAIEICLSYSPLPSRLRTVNPAFLASETDSGLSFIGELKDEKTLRTGFLHAGQLVSGLADSGRFNVNFPPHTVQPPSHNSYS